MAPVIRVREDDDLPVLGPLLADVHKAHRYPIHWPHDPAAWLTPPDMAAAWVAMRGGEVVGHVCLVHDQPPHDLALERLFISPRVAGLGVGRALVTQASDWAIQQGQRLTLNLVENCTDAIALYKRLGWHQAGRTEIDWANGAARYLLRFDAP